MKGQFIQRASITLNLLLLLLIAGYAFFHHSWQRSIRSSVSPDGRWRCTVTNVNPNPYQVTLMYSIEEVDVSFPLSGTQYISYEDSALPDDMKFDWASNKLIVTAGGKKLIAEFEKGQQHWKEMEAQTQ